MSGNDSLDKVSVLFVIAAERGHLFFSGPDCKVWRAFPLMEHERSVAAKPLPARHDDPDAVDMSLIDSLVGYNLRRAAARQRERFRNVFTSHGIRPAQLTALTIILHNDRLGQSALGKAMDIKRANVVKLLDELQQRGLIERTPSTRDRRAYELRLTPRGRKLTRELLAVHRKLEANLALSLGCDELKQLVKLLRKFRSVDPAPDLT